MQYVAHGTNDFKKISKVLNEVHPGSWFGLPDFGITEAVGGLFGVPRNQQGGSNLSGRSIVSPIPASQTSSKVYGSGGTATGFNTGSSGPAYTAPTSVQGTSTSSGGGGGSYDPHINPATGIWDDNYYAANHQPDYAEQTRNAINSGYDAYFGQLDDILNNGLPQQRTAQEGIANSQYQQGVDTLGSQKTLGQHDLQTTRDKATTQQSKTLTDLGDNIRNLFQAGNVYLGAKGAADSSAANQYSYALTKLGSKQRGDVTGQYAGIQNDINDREFKLNETYNSEVNNLKSTLDQQIQSIGSWFAEQQNALKQAKAQGQLSKGQDLANLSQNLLNVALQQVQNVQAQAQAQHSALQEWALNHSNSIAQVKQNLAGLSQTNYNMPAASPVSGQPAFSGGGGNPSLFGYGTSETPKRDIFGNTIA